MVDLPLEYYARRRERRLRYMTCGLFGGLALAGVCWSIVPDAWWLWCAITPLAVAIGYGEASDPPRGWYRMKPWVANALGVVSFVLIAVFSRIMSDAADGYADGVYYDPTWELLSINSLGLVPVLFFSVFQRGYFKSWRAPRFDEAHRNDTVG